MKTGIEQGLRKKILTLEEQEIILEGPDPDEWFEFFQKFQVGEFYDRFAYNTSDKHAMNKMENYIQMLRKAGLNISKGYAEYGYRMPLPKEGETFRCLRIFRRR